MDSNIIGILLPYYFFTAIIAAMGAGTITVMLEIIGWIILAITKTSSISKGSRSRFAIIIFAIFFISLSVLSTYKVVHQRRTAEQLVAYCEKYKQKYGEYPEKVENLVPEFFDNEQLGVFQCHSSLKFIHYRNSDGYYRLWYVTGVPFQTNNYSFDDKKWYAMD